MATANMVHEAARQILEHSSDIHGALALAGRHDLVGTVIKIQKKAAVILKLERPHADPLVSARQDTMNAIGCLGHAIVANIDDWPEIDGEALVMIYRLAETFVSRANRYMEMVAVRDMAELSNGYMEGDDECA